MFKQESLVSAAVLPTRCPEFLPPFTVGFIQEANHPHPPQRLHKFHVRYVKTIAPVFTPLAELNEISISHSGQIMTFQGHPELTSEISHMLSGRDDGTYKPTKSAEASDEGIVIEDAGSPHDGELIWKYIMEWALA